MIQFCLPVTEQTSDALQLHPYAQMAWGLLSKIPQVDLLVLMLVENAQPLFIWMPGFLDTGRA